MSYATDVIDIVEKNRNDEKLYKKNTNPSDCIIVKIGGDDGAVQQKHEDASSVEST